MSQQLEAWNRLIQHAVDENARPKSFNVDMVLDIQGKAWKAYGAEIRRLEKRLDGLARAACSFACYELPSGIKVELVNGQVQVEFPWKPDEASRSVLKRSPLALKWSSYSGRWVRKHTATTAGRYFQTSLKEALETMSAEGT